jgi:hypothetical protein
MTKFMGLKPAIIGMTGIGGTFRVLLLQAF